MSLRVAVLPAGVRPFCAEAVEAGGGVVVDPQDAEAVVWTDPDDADALRALLDRHPQISWVQLPWAGIEPMLGVLDHDRTWTSGKGVYAEEVAEHALAMTLAGMRHLVEYAREERWSPPAGRNLLGANVTILGAGGITRSLLRLLEPFGCRIRLVRRTPDPVEGVDVVTTISGLDTLLEDTDVLIIALALTAETVGVLDGRRLDLLPAHAWVVNVGRGAHVVTSDLVDALVGGKIAGAALDVTEPEPLPPDHRLWSLPNCLITPHVANTPEMGEPVLRERITENVGRRCRGERLLGVVDVDAGY